MKGLSALSCVVLCALGGPALAEPYASAMRVINLGSQPIVAFSIESFGFQDVGLDARHGEVMTPNFGDGGGLDYELYWRFEDGSLHSAVLDFRRLLPATFHGHVFISLHDDHAGVTWASQDPAWLAHQSQRLPKVEDKPRLPLFDSCAGPLLTDPVGLKAWHEAEARVRKRIEENPGLAIEPLERCDLEAYILKTPGRAYVQLEEKEEARLHREWRAEIERMRRAR